MTTYNNDPRFFNPTRSSYDPDSPENLAKSKTIDELLDMRQNARKAKLEHSRIDEAIRRKLI